MKYRIKNKIYSEEEGKKIIENAYENGEKLKFEIQTDNYEKILRDGLADDEEVLHTFKVKMNKKQFNTTIILMILAGLILIGIGLLLKN